ncbi:MAG TPA: glycosyltransferase family 39 protein [Candidatus Portnoybacteria bacterium]|nr:glycosyltransferase family 39 protein [Candidatus Portnoybacteria bacterium]MDD5752045.1 glycosyltransferase family 39 protein [Candidatus Portnoybacteria bacterium]HOZ16395.1 glycosyltransferase family 39 protein [Candidatus Portnoybacteria bacterium]HPH52055.1 glycosyltransferase family 39 protein [Candidatus Portnoybacteria bacterium]HPJ80204.1 glycosyltransferase family 39 protein [Candidatus Portnoybacteria bacterium]
MKKLSPILSIAFIILMLILTTISQKQESAIMDEVAHIPAGYSYLTQKDMRLNPEHPPLLKDLSAIPLLFIKNLPAGKQNINFPDQIKSWTDEINSQWDFGFKFLYNSGNNADKIIFWSRIPMLLLLILLGIFIYRWTKELYGKIPALFATILFVFSPTFLAHGRYVTTDVGAAFAFFFASYFFIKFLKNQNTKNLFLAGIAFGIAQLIKFSLFLLLPYFGLLTLIWIYIKWRENKHFWKTFFKNIGLFLIVLVIGYLLVYPVYMFHIANYPIEKQISDTTYIASQFPFKKAGEAVIWMSKQPILRPYAQYTLGLFMVFLRATGGNTTYFLGDVTNQGWRNYFPIVYAIKEPLALHIFTIIALLIAIWQIRLRKFQDFKLKIENWFKKYFVEISMLIFLAIYWGASLTSNLNIGVRHILPTFPFVYILISGQIKKLFEKIHNKNLFRICGVGLGVLLCWYMISSLLSFPYYLTYFNELAGGNKNGHVYVTDSNLDWGQDLKRLAEWVEKNNIPKIYIDYFGGGIPSYYLGDKAERWWGNRNPAEAKGKWLAISATFKQQGQAQPTKGWTQPTDFYMWLNQYQPVTVIGNSIFVYRIQ